MLILKAICLYLSVFFTVAVAHCNTALKNECEPIDMIVVAIIHSAAITGFIVLQWLM